MNQILEFAADVSDKFYIMCIDTITFARIAFPFAIPFFAVVTIRAFIRSFRKKED